MVHTFISKSWSYLSIAKKADQFFKSNLQRKSSKNPKQVKLTMFDSQKQWIKIIKQPPVLDCEIKLLSSSKYFSLNWSNKFSKRV